MFKRKVRMKDMIDVFYKKIIVLKVKQDAEIYQDARSKPDPGPQFFMGIHAGEQITQQVIQADAGQYDGEIIDVEIAVKP